jgi:RNA polymerase sigma factor FliA
MDDDARQPPAPDPRLTPEQQAMVARASSRVPYVARSVRALVGGLSFDECESAGYEALVRAALRYDPATGVPFMAFAYQRVRGAMVDAAREARPDRRRLARMVRLIEATSELAAPPTATAGDPRTLAERVEAAAAIVRQVTTAVVLSRAAAEVDSGQPDLEAWMVDEQTRGRLRRAIDRCDADEQGMIEALYFRGLSMHAYAEESGISASTVSRRHARVLKRLAEWYGEDDR